MVNNSKVVFNKIKIDFNPLRKQQHSKKLIAKASSKNHCIKCFKCNQFGHKILECNLKRFGHTLVKQIWVPKRTLTTNPYRLKKARVPKIKK